MTYKQLLQSLSTRPEETLTQTATVYLGEADEYIQVFGLSFTEENDVLDENHLVLEVQF
jgi:K+ transporter